MFPLKFQKISLSFLILATSINNLWADSSKAVSSQNEECCMFNSRLKLTELCADKITVDCANVHQVSSNKARLANVCSDLICTKNINISEDFSAPQITTDTICANTVITSDIFSTGTNYSHKFNNKYRASAAFSADTTYTLGSVLDFDIITDDPNNNISFSPTKYTAPLSGYYMVTLQVNQYNLNSSLTILGTPIANITMLVNGVSHREIYTPYLSFLNQQKITFSGLVSLSAGDQVTFIYNLLTMSQTSGVIQIPGTVTVEGCSAIPNNKSIFKIIYLSSNEAIPTPPTCRITPPLDCSTCVCTPCCQPSNCSSNDYHHKTPSND